MYYCFIELNNSKFLIVQLKIGKADNSKFKIQNSKLQIEDSFGSFVHEQVERRHVGLEALAQRVHLIILAWREVSIGQRTLRTDGVAEVVDAQFCPTLCA